MIEEQAVVVAVEKERAYLNIERSNPCGLCGATQGCGISVWGKLFGRSQRRISTTNLLEAHVGDRVVIGIREDALLTGSVAAYLVPLLLLCLGAVLGGYLSEIRSASDLYAGMGAFLGLMLGLAWVRFVMHNTASEGVYQPVMLRRSESISVRYFSR